MRDAVRHQRRERKAARRAKRLAARGPARRHWDRRRRRTANSAPELRNRTSGVVEDEVVGGGRRAQGRKRGYRSTAEQIKAYKGVM